MNNTKIIRVMLYCVQIEASSNSVNARFKPNSFSTFKTIVFSLKQCRICHYITLRPEFKDYMTYEMNYHFQEYFRVVRASKLKI